MFARRRPSWTAPGPLRYRPAPGGYPAAPNGRMGMVVERERRGRVEIIAIARPEARNAVNGDVAQAVEAALDDLEADDEVWAVVVTGRGPVFSAGADLKAIAAG